MTDRLVETTLGDFRLECLLGHGSVGRVYRATQLSLHRPVAVKVLEEGLFTLPERTQRFLREGGIVARLNHPHIVPVYAAGNEGSLHFLAMELIDGENLEIYAARKKVGPRRATEIVRDIARAVAYAHANGILHRDLKPANILVKRHNGHVWVTDFGLAKDLRLSDPKLTASSVIMGTPAYMAPEQAAGRPGWAADVYGLDRSTPGRLATSRRSV